MLADLEEGYAHRVAFVVPTDTAWTLPLYELALMTARQAWSMGRDRIRFSLVTPEERPLALFGAPASEAVAELLKQHAIDFVGSSYASVGHGYVLADPGGRRIEVDRVVALPTLDGPDLWGVPADAAGFIPVDRHGRVPGLTGVYAAGDGTTFPIKQGGLATQQADAVAETIAAAVGAPVQPEPFRPVLRGMLLTGGDERYLRHDVAGGAGEGELADHALWWPPTKIAGRYLAAYLFGRDEGHVVEDIRAAHLEVEIPLAPGATAGHAERRPD
jgi:sulfide:quinone oxidoreductase